jgi:RNA polymerase sigma-70 factor (ECF subfamily)
LVHLLEPALLASSAALSDEEIVERVCRGESALYQVLMRRHNQRVYRTARAILRDEQDVEDVLQDAYLSAFRSLDRFERRSRFSTWLVRITVHHAIDRSRRRARLVPVEPGFEDALVARRGAALSGSHAVDPERVSGARELTRLVESGIDALPDPYRVVFVLREVESLDTEEVAACLGIEPATVKTRLHRARGLLRARLEQALGAAARDAFPFGGARCDGLVAAVMERLGDRLDA